MISTYMLLSINDTMFIVDQPGKSIAPVGKVANGRSAGSLRDPLFRVEGCDFFVVCAVR
jgi:hypothetical protein